MSRTIKFRAWDKQIGLMEPTIKTIRIHTDLNELIEDSSARYDLMQFTGLLDKNGKEIYEGDFVEWDDYYEKRHIATVQWLEEFARFDLSTDGTLPLSGISRRHRLKVIGNIQETPIQAPNP